MRRTIKVDALARVEGEGAMYVRLDGDTVADVQLRIYEPPRFFEAFLRGRAFTEAPDITARICGICPVAYQTSSVRAMENAAGVAIDDGPIRTLRRLLYCGEWLESHALHVHMLHAPDFLGYDSAIAMVAEHRAIVERGLLIKKAGNTLMEVIGGRAVHPVNVRVGGFYRAPTPAELRPAAELLERAREAALETVHWTAGLPFPDIELDHELVALRVDGEYPIDRGRIASSAGLDIAPGAFDEVFEEQPVAHSNALHARVRARGSYLTGPLARFNLSFDSLSPAARDAALGVGVGPTCRNPFQSIVVRSVEMLYACDEALRIIGSYEPPDPPAVEVVPRRGVGFGASEAPRGMCWHRYEIDDDGTIRDARIVPPTSQNQLAIEQDLRRVVERHAALGDDELRHRCEQAIRNHDPCISCATHFLALDVDRS
jgi:coenzyme F420-reducing hydrogenase alpha subunit